MSVTKQQALFSGLRLALVATALAVVGVVSLLAAALFLFALCAYALASPRKTRRGPVTLLLVLSWGVVCAMVWREAGVALGLAVLVPLPFLAGALRALYAHRIELHRLRLAREAIEAMLGARDPLPMMTSLLGSLHAPSMQETLHIYGTVTAEERLTPLARVGTELNEAQLASCRDAISQLQRNVRSRVVKEVGESVVTAFAVRGRSETLLGALVVVRPADSASPMPSRRFAEAAAELAPLLRDFRSIAATQDAASIDGLTRLPNRRTIMQIMRAHIERVGIGNPCAALLLDIDRFKSINDTLGHLAGDRCLRTIGKAIAANIRSMDRAGRIGGEEFVVLMPDTTSEMALAVGERLRGAIEASGLQYAGGEPVTASVGVAVASVSDTVDSLLARADRALYEAKRQGRNRVIEISA